MPSYRLESMQKDVATPKYGNLTREKILDVLDQVKSNKSEAARILGISRSWLYEKMRKCGIF